MSRTIERNSCISLVRFVPMIPRIVYSSYFSTRNEQGGWEHVYGLRATRHPFSDAESNTGQGHSATIYVFCSDKTFRNMTRYIMANMQMLSKNVTDGKQRVQIHDRCCLLAGNHTCAKAVHTFPCAREAEEEIEKGRRGSKRHVHSINSKTAHDNDPERRESSPPLLILPLQCLLPAATAASCYKPREMTSIRSTANAPGTPRGVMVRPSPLG